MSTNIEFIYGKGVHKTQQQKDYKAVTSYTKKRSWTQNSNHFETAPFFISLHKNNIFLTKTFPSESESISR